MENHGFAALEAEMVRVGRFEGLHGEFGDRPVQPRIEGALQVVLRRIVLPRGGLGGHVGPVVGVDLEVGLVAQRLQPGGDVVTAVGQRKVIGGCRQGEGGGHGHRSRVMAGTRVLCPPGRLFPRRPLFASTQPRVD
ncbi:hypothetical protein D3C78_1439150 [compost metagenome]